MVKPEKYILNADHPFRMNPVLVGEVGKPCSDYEDARFQFVASVSQSMGTKTNEFLEMLQVYQNGEVKVDSSELETNERVLQRSVHSTGDRVISSELCSAIESTLCLDLYDLQAAMAAKRITLVDFLEDSVLLHALARVVAGKLRPRKYGEPRRDGTIVVSKDPFQSGKGNEETGLYALRKRLYELYGIVSNLKGKK